MSETVSLEFIGRRLDSIQADTADVRRRMIALGERFGSVETRIGGLESRLDGIDRRFATIEDRMDAMVERQGKLELTCNRTLFLLERLALKVGGIEGDAMLG
jgi:hypothetical protein